MNNPNKPVTTKFEDLLYQVLEPESTVYASPSIGESPINSITDHANCSELIISKRELNQLNNELYRQKITLIDSVEDYLESTDNFFQAEFLAPPWPYTERILRQPEETDKLLEQWAEQSNDAVDTPGTTYYSSNVWEDPRIGLNTSIDLAEVENTTSQELSKYFKKVDRVEGEDFSGIIAIR